MNQKTILRQRVLNFLDRFLYFAVTGPALIPAQQTNESEQEKHISRDGEKYCYRT